MHLPKTTGTALTRASRGHQAPTVGVVLHPRGWEDRQEEAPCNAGHRGGFLPMRGEPRGGMRGRPHAPHRAVGTCLSGDPRPPWGGAHAWRASAAPASGVETSPNATTHVPGRAAIRLGSAAAAAPWAEEPPEAPWEPEVIDYGHRPADLPGGAKFESFDYGHGKSAEDKRQLPQVMDYGHGAPLRERRPIFDDLDLPPGIPGRRLSSLYTRTASATTCASRTAIVRGPPGSGKSFLTRLLKEREMGAAGSVAPRVLALDDYFMQEVEVSELDADTGKRVKRKEFRYEYEAEMEDVYFSSLLKSFRKTVDGRLFSFVLVDAVLARLEQLEQFTNYARQNGFQVYICEPDCLDPEECHRRNVHGRSLEDIQRIVDSWEPAPRQYPRLDCSILLNEMEDMDGELPPADSQDSVAGGGSEGDGNDAAAPKKEEKEEEEEEEEDEPVHKPSRWELMTETTSSGERLLKLDGLSGQKLKHTSMDDYLQLPDDYEERHSEPGKKRVRWADIEESKQQKRMRDIGFVVGQTDWSKFTDPTQAEKALTRTKYI
ncbi:hypothetical protein MRX96_033722 [Rhipicephalus microplus]